jgi:hypothetical protein
MANKPESPKILHILIPAATTLLVAIIGLGTAIYQTEKPIQLTEIALTAQAASQTAQAPTLLAQAASQTAAVPTLQLQLAETALAPTFSAQTLQAAVALTVAAKQPIPATPVPTNPPGVTVINKLRLGVKISIDGVYQGDLAGGAARTYPLQNSTASVSWDVIKQVTTKGAPIGHDMDGIFKDSSNGDELTIDNVIDEQAYFYPIISNTTATDCSVVINQGLKSEFVTNAIVPANSQNIEYGYYKLFTNSNVTLHCEGELHWWGNLPDNGNPDSFFNDVEPETGVIYFTLKP